MKCINCGTDNNLRDRQEHQGRCKNCGTPFALEPTTMGDKKITDAAFLKILNDISANGTLYFTKQQLFYAIAKHPLKRQDLPFLFVFFFIFVLLALFFILPMSWNPSALPILGLAYIAIWLLGLWFRSQNLSLLRRERLRAAKALRNLGIIAIVAGLLGLFFVKNGLSALVLGLLGVGSINLSFWQQRRIPKTPEAPLPVSEGLFAELLERWTQAHGAPEKLLSPAVMEDVFPLPSEEVTNYSFDRLIVCQSDDIAKMLIANNVPFEYNSGVVSIQGYPYSLFPTIMTMAKRNPRLGVYVLHDCSADGLRCLHTVTHDPQWFGGQDYLLVDVGLSPRQILSAKKPVFSLNSTEAMRSALKLSPEIRRTLSPAELQWLDTGNYVLLEFFPPQRIIQALSRSLSLGAQVDTIEDGSTSLLILGDSDFYGVESFG
jgi:hypothetical protein